MKKILALLLAMTFVFAFVSCDNNKDANEKALGAYQPGYANNYEELMLEVFADNAVTINSDFELEGPVVVDGFELEIDLNGNTITSNFIEDGMQRAFVAKNGGKLTVKNGNVVLKVSDDYALASNNLFRTENADLVLDNVVATLDRSEVNVRTDVFCDTLLVNARKGNVEIINSSLKSYNFVVSSNGKQNPTNIKAVDSTFVSTNDVAIYSPASGKVELTDCTVSGLNSAVQFRSGDVVINGGTYISTSNSPIYVPDSAEYVDGASIALPGYPISFIAAGSKYASYGSIEIDTREFENEEDASYIQLVRKDNEACEVLFVDTTNNADVDVKVGANVPVLFGYFESNDKISIKEDMTYGFKVVDNTNEAEDEVESND